MILEALKNCRTTYSLTLLASIGIIALIGLLNIWGVSTDESFTAKLIFSCLVISGLSVFLYVMTHYDHDMVLVTKLGGVIAAIVIALSVMILAQTWFDLFKDHAFGQLSTTLVIIVAILAFAIGVLSDFFENKKLKDENYLD